MVVICVFSDNGGSSSLSAVDGNNGCSGFSSVDRDDGGGSLFNKMVVVVVSP